MLLTTDQEVLDMYPRVIEAQVLKVDMQIPVEAHQYTETGLL
jgi:hypothetical protein